MGSAMPLRRDSNTPIPQCSNAQSLTTTQFLRRTDVNQIPFTQQVGEALRQMGIDAFIVWSYADWGGRNLNIFPEKIREGENWIHISLV